MWSGGCRMQKGYWGDSTSPENLVRGANEYQDITENVRISPVASSYIPCSTCNRIALHVFLWVDGKTILGIKKARLLPRN